MNENRLREIVRTILSECIDERQLEKDNLVQKLDLEEMETIDEKWEDTKPAGENEFHKMPANPKGWT